MPPRTSTGCCHESVTLMMTKNRNTLDLAGDGDDDELLEAVETEFGVCLTAGEVEGITTIGDLADLVEHRIVSTRGAPCLSARAFRRIRKALPAGARPTTRLSEYCGPEQAHDFLYRLGKVTGLELHIASWAVWTSRIAEGLFFPIAMVAPLFAFYGQYPSAVLAFVAAAFLWGRYRLPAASPADLTLAEVVRHTLGQNYRELRADAPSGTRADIWTALTGICCFYACHTGSVDRDTTLFSNTIPQPTTRKD